MWFGFGKKSSKASTEASEEASWWETPRGETQLSIDQRGPEHVIRDLRLGTAMGLSDGPKLDVCVFEFLTFDGSTHAFLLDWDHASAFSYTMWQLVLDRVAALEINESGD